MSDSNKAFDAIKSFIGDLYLVFGGKTNISKPLSFYHRLTTKAENQTPQTVDKVLKSFKDFLLKYDENIVNDTLKKIPNGTRITFGDSKIVYIEINKYIYLSDAETLTAIRHHLVTISALVLPSDNKLKELERIKTYIESNSPEQKFVEKMLGKVKGVMESIGGSENLSENPADALMKLMSSGVLNDLSGMFKGGVDNNNLDLGKMLKSMHTEVGKLMDDPEKFNELVSGSAASSSGDGNALESNLPASSTEVKLD